MRKQITYATCPKCKKEWRTKRVPFLNIEEGAFGEDIMTFECPDCKLDVRSRVYSK